MVILAIGNEDILLNKDNEVGCMSANSNNDYLLDYSRPRPQYVQTDPTRACSFLNMVISCKTVPSPTSVYLFDSRKSTGRMVKLEYEEPVMEKLGIVSCTSSIYFGERWQLYLTSIEYHHYFGVTRQIYYLMSALNGVYQLLREYEKEKIVDLRFWSIPQVPELRSLDNIWNRDQIGTLNDCFMRYREAADFIIVHDPDELLWMKEGYDYYEKFVNSWNLRTIFLNVRNIDTEIWSGRDLMDFDLEKSLTSIRFNGKEHPLKSIYKPSLVETIWVHWALIYNKTMERTWVNVDEMKFIHVRNWIFSNESIFDEYMPSLFSPHHIEAISTVSKSRISRFQKINKFLRRLTFTDFYYSTFDDCLRPSFDRCLSFELCRPIIPILLNQTCVQYSNPIGNWIVVSSTYYEVSKFYEDDTVALLLNADQSVSRNQEWLCVSRNQTHESVTVTKPRDAFIPVQICRMQTFIATCKSVRNPNFFGLTTKQFIREKTVPIPIRHPVKERFPLVSCFSPLFFNERWQLIITSIELYKYYGVHLQAYYFMSATLPIYQLLQTYEKLKIIEINPWVLQESTNQAKYEMQYRNQAAAHSDCFLKYREAADFVIVSDVDDVLIPIKTGNLYKELLDFWNIHSMAAFLVFQRLNSEIQVAEKLKNFQISKSLETIKIGPKRPSAKSVYNTKHVEAVWIHWAYLLKSGSQRIDVEVNRGHFIHLRDWVFLKNGSYRNPIDSVISTEIATTIEENFTSRSYLVPNLNSSTFHYYDHINTCYDGFLSGETPGCPTHLSCKMPAVVGLKCAQAVSQFKKYKLSDIFSLTTTIGPTVIKIMENGCFE